jgi:hypothetical protein
MALLKTPPGRRGQAHFCSADFAKMSQSPVGFSTESPAMNSCHSRREARYFETTGWFSANCFSATRSTLPVALIGI